MSEVPYYLQPNSPANTTQQFGQFDLYDFNSAPVDYVGDQSAVTQVWHELGGAVTDTVNTAGNYTWDAVNGVWNASKDFGSDLLKAGDDWFSSLKWNFVLMVGGFLVVIWIIAKSGILKQASAFIPLMG